MIPDESALFTLGVADYFYLSAPRTRGSTGSHLVMLVIL